MKTETIQYNIGGVFLSSLFNGDNSGLDGEDEKHLNDFLETIPAIANDSNADSWHWSCKDTEASFMTCDICSLKADCYEVDLVLMLN